MNAPEQPSAPAFRASLYVDGPTSLYVDGPTERGLVLDPADAKALGIALVRASVEGRAVRLVLPPRATDRDYDDTHRRQPYWRW